MKNFYAALNTYFNALDSITGEHNAFWNDIGGRFYNGQAPDDAQYPYCVFTHVNGNPDDDFKNKNDEILLQFSIFLNNQSPVEVMDAADHLQALYDDCTLSITSATLVNFIRGADGLIPENIETPEGTQQAWHYHVDYNIYIQRT